MTKEEILEHWFPTPEGAQETQHILKAMDEYARQQAIVFVNWTLSADSDTFSCTDEDQWTNIFTKENVTTADVYDAYIKFIEQSIK